MATIHDELSGFTQHEPEPNTIQSIEEAKIYRVAYADGSSQGKVGLLLRFPGDQVYLVDNPREKLPLLGVHDWFRAAFFKAIGKQPVPVKVPTSEELLGEAVEVK